MPTIINNPGNGEGSSGAAGMLIGVVAVVLVLILFFVYGLPMIRNSNAPTQEASKTNSLDVNVTIPKAEEPAE